MAALADGAEIGSLVIKRGSDQTDPSIPLALS